MNGKREPAGFSSATGQLLLPRPSVGCGVKGLACSTALSSCEAERGRPATGYSRHGVQTHHLTCNLPRSSYAWISNTNGGTAVARGKPCKANYPTLVRTSVCLPKHKNGTKAEKAYRDKTRVKCTLVSAWPTAGNIVPFQKPYRKEDDTIGGNVGNYDGTHLSDAKNVDGVLAGLEAADHDHHAHRLQQRSVNASHVQDHPKRPKAAGLVVPVVSCRGTPAIDRVGQPHAKLHARRGVNPAKSSSRRALGVSARGVRM